METIKHLSQIVVFTAMLCSCGSLLHYTTIEEKAQNIKPGMTGQEVRNILGNNFYLSFNESDTDTWEYRTNPIYHDYSVIKIEFKDGRVTGMDSHLEVNPYIPEKPKEKE